MNSSKSIVALHADFINELTARFIRAARTLGRDGVIRIPDSVQIYKGDVRYRIDRVTVNERDCRILFGSGTQEWAFEAMNVPTLVTVLEALEMQDPGYGDAYEYDPVWIRETLVRFGHDRSRPFAPAGGLDIRRFYASDNLLDESFEKVRAMFVEDGRVVVVRADGEYPLVNSHSDIIDRNSPDGWAGIRNFDNLSVVEKEIVPLILEANGER